LDVIDKSKAPPLLKGGREEVKDKFHIFLSPAIYAGDIFNKMFTGHFISPVWVYPPNFTVPSDLSN
jgi:hypothetical protein